ncbi:hypothetical protein MJG53_006176 [Ovis ammon polii x Ovis aries]|uniref:Uncharacterized protein n=1 Tax=Ovis ammon polii x Ovis aries TaxID=2918886 RepID=A0ACB9V838_9CETA|nr:hypothetical protein MJG53_006176 [Ovis ammon polii x Ovis aries]
MVTRPWSSSRLSCGERLLLRCDGNAGNSFPTKQEKDPSSRARRRKRGSPGCVRDPGASSRVETGLSHVHTWWESILGLNVKAVQGKLVPLEWTETSAGLLEWCSRLPTGTSGSRSAGLRKGQSPGEFLGGLSRLLSRRCRGLRPCVESVSEPEDSSPVLTWILRCDGNARKSFPKKQGKDPSSRARRQKRGSPGCVRDPDASSRVETGPWSSSRLSCGERLLLRCDGNARKSFPKKQGKDPSSRARRQKRGSPGCVRDPDASSPVETGLSHVHTWWESILGLNVKAVQGKQVPLEWTETSAGLLEWWHDPGVPLAFPVESASS